MGNSDRDVGRRAEFHCEFQVGGRLRGRCVADPKLGKVVVLDRSAVAAFRQTAAAPRAYVRASARLEPGVDRIPQGDDDGFDRLVDGVLEHLDPDGLRRLVRREGERPPLVNEVGAGDCQPMRGRRRAAEFVRDIVHRRRRSAGSPKGHDELQMTGLGAIRTVDRHGRLLVVVVDRPRRRAVVEFGPDRCRQRHRDGLGELVPGVVQQWKCDRPIDVAGRERQLARGPRVVFAGRRRSVRSRVVHGYFTAVRAAACHCERHVAVALGSGGVVHGQPRGPVVVADGARRDEITDLVLQRFVRLAEVDRESLRRRLLHVVVGDGNPDRASGHAGLEGQRGVRHGGVVVPCDRRPVRRRVRHGDGGLDGPRQRHGKGQLACGFDVGDVADRHVRERLVVQDGELGVRDRRITDCEDWDEENHTFGIRELH